MTTSYLVNGIYPLEYFTQAGVDQIQYPNEFWWQSKMRHAREGDRGQYNPNGTLTDEYLELDLSRVRQVNYIKFSLLRAPINIRIDYDAESDNDANHRWVEVTPLADEAFDDQAHYNASARAAWNEHRFYFTDTQGNTVNTRFIRIRFRRRDQEWPHKGARPFRWSIMVRNLRTARFINHYGDTLGTLFESGLPFDLSTISSTPMGITEAQYNDSSVLSSDTIKQQFGLPFNSLRGTTNPNILGFSVLVFVEPNSPTVEFDNNPNETLVEMQWSIHDATDRTIDPILLKSGIAKGSLTDGTTWINVYFDPEEAIATDSLSTIYEVRIKSTSVHVDANDGLGVRTVFGKFIEQPRCVPGVSLGIGTFTNGSPTVTLVDTPVDIEHLDIIQRVDQIDDAPVVVDSISMKTITLTGNYPGVTVTTEIERVLPLTEGSLEVDYVNSMTMRLWADVGDNGRDVLGNSYRYATKINPPSQALVTGQVGWMSEPQPSSDAVEAMYFDVRDGNQGSVIDAIKIAPRTPGIVMHVYYTNQHLNSITPQTTKQWDRLIWTPVNKTYTLTGSATITLPTTIKAGFIKLEFSKLQPRPLHVPDKPDPPYSVFRRYPTWIENQFDNSSIRRTVEDWFHKASQQGLVKINALKFISDPVLEFQYKEREFLAALATNKKFDAESRNSGLINTTTNTFIDPTTASKINVNTTRMYQSPLTLLTDRDSLLGQTIASQTDPRQPASVREGGFEVSRGIPPVSSSNNRVAESFAHLTQLPMWFNRQSRHLYKLDKGKFGKQAFYAGISYVEFLRKDYSQARDDTLVTENLLDSFLIDSNTWITEFPSRIAALVGETTTVLTPTSSPVNLLVTYEIDGIVTTDEELTFLYFDQTLSLGNSGTTQAINVQVYQEQSDGSRGTQFFPGTDYDISLSIDVISGNVVNNMSINTKSTRLVVSQIGTDHDASVVIGKAVVSSVDNLSGPVVDAEIVIGHGVVGSVSDGGNTFPQTDSGTGTTTSKKGLHGADTGTGTDHRSRALTRSTTDSAIVTFTDSTSINLLKVRHDSGIGTEVSTGAPLVDDEFSRTVVNGIGTADTGQAWIIDQAPLADYAVNSGQLQVTMQPSDAPIMHVNIDKEFVNSLYTYHFSSNAVGSTQVFGPTWWAIDQANYYRLTITQTTGGNTNLKVEQQVANTNTIVPMDWGSGLVTTTKAIPTSQIPSTPYWCRVQVFTSLGTPTFRVKVWAASVSEPSNTPGVSGTTIVGQGPDIGGATNHGGTGFRGQTLPTNTNKPTYFIDSYTVIA